ncbi:alpha/beta hydrolase [Nocardioides marmoriginsengisoli]|uniref:Alpha/beta hydrolase n=1 Tax=Nocardioides marmoriginsengisoli TaxID=661483 RepID=A0A3N0CPM7_9ACTN|nr:alpha/beta hydrolase [Nocardioides marmoriginsengisoli]RNL65320.1 alpha/beta hydrolase [Nocardioides marmoriginsengisoli]
MDEIRIDLPQVSLSALTWGPADGPLALLLHGFPDTARTWRHLGPDLAADGWRVVAPYLRGYAPSDVPADGRGDVAALISDVLGLHAALGGGPDAVLVGHDWGAITANALAAHEDCPFAKVVTLSVPPFAALRSPNVARSLPRQLRSSWYILFNRLPWLPERAYARLVRKLWRDWSPGYDAAEDLPAVLAAMAGPENRRTIIGYYRALLSPFGPPPAYRRWKGAEMRLPLQPILSLHGDRDGCLDPRLAALAEPHLPPGSQVVLVPEAGHFLQLEQPAAVNHLIRAYLA